MEDEPPTIGFEDGTIDVERLLVEPPNGHVSVDSATCFNEKVPEKPMDIEDISHNFGVTNTDVDQERRNIPNRDVLDLVSNETDVGYFRLQNDFCSMGEDYLLGYTGVGFSESITNLDYDPDETLLTSVSDNSVLAPSASPWKADLFRIMELPDCPNDRLSIETSDFGEVPSLCNESESLTDEMPPKSPTSSTSRDINKFQNTSANSQEMLPDEENRFSQNVTKEKDDAFGLMGQNIEPNISEIISTRVECAGGLTKQKRSRRPTQRYIDEFTNPIPRIPKRKREVSYSIGKDKSGGGDKDDKKCRVGSKSLVLGDEESSIVAIQVPFGPLVHKECPRNPTCDMNRGIGTWHKQVRRTDRGHPGLRSKDNRFMSENQDRRDEFLASGHPMKIDHSPTTAASQKKADLNVTSKTQFKKRDQKKNEFLQETGPKNDNLAKTANKIIREECPSEESSEEASGRRKHHRLWTIAEVKKLIDGVSEYGVGRWSRIKKLSFSASAHRTSVDLKDKWRNLLKASRMQLGNQQGEKKRNMAWRPLPISILRRVCELANMYPYPKGRTRRGISLIDHDSPDRSTDITLSDYRRILRSINGN